MAIMWSYLKMSIILVRSSTRFAYKLVYSLNYTLSVDHNKNKRQKSLKLYCKLHHGK